MKKQWNNVLSSEKPPSLQKKGNPGFGRLYTPQSGTEVIDHVKCVYRTHLTCRPLFKQFWPKMGKNFYVVL